MRCKCLQVQYVVYGEEALQELENRVLAEVTSVLSITESEALRLLRLYKWCAVAKLVGLPAERK